MKHIFLVDMNAFFIMCESIHRPELLEVPAAVGGDPKTRRGIILTSNYKARAYGVRTAMTINEALKLCPDLTIVRSTKGLYSKCSTAVFDILRQYTPLVEPSSIDEGYMDVTGSTDLFGPPEEIARTIMEEIKNELGLWCSIGISENKFLAKMASEMKKPLGITKMYRKDIEKMMWPLPVGNIHGVGKSSAKRLRQMGLNTIGDIARANPDFIREKFGIWVYDRANGYGSDVVCGEHKVKSASISRSSTTASNISDIEEAKKLMLHLAEDVGQKARKKNLKGKTVQITLRYTNFQTITRQKVIFPTNLTREIVKTGYELLEQNWDPERPVRLIGIGLANINKEDTQMNVFDTVVNKKEVKLEETLDSLKEKYGTDKFKRGSGI
jgi:DNA polymerase-4